VLQINRLQHFLPNPITKEEYIGQMKMYSPQLMDELKRTLEAME
jgi:hypothetical protein